eukprot:7241549-Pyramimonas_sp.AAC.1
MPERVPSAASIHSPKAAERQGVLAGAQAFDPHLWKPSRTGGHLDQGIAPDALEAQQHRRVRVQPEVVERVRARHRARGQVGRRDEPV